MMHAATTAVRTLAGPASVASRSGRPANSLTVEGTLGAVFLACLALTVLLGLATAGLAVYRYRNRGDPTLRAFVVGLVLVAVAPLPFRIFIAGTVPPVLRDIVPPILQTLGLVAILWAMYGDPRSTGWHLSHRPTPGDLLVVGLSVALAATVALGGIFESDSVIVFVAAVVAGLATFVAGQAARAAYRYRSLAMGSLSVGILCLAALPMPVSVVLAAVGGFPEPVVVGLLFGVVLAGEAAMLVTLLYR